MGMTLPFHGFAAQDQVMGQFAGLSPFAPRKGVLSRSERRQTEDRVSNVLGIVFAQSKRALCSFAWPTGSNAMKALFGWIVGVCGLTFLTIAVLAQQPAGQEEGVEVQTRGPIHEAFAQPGLQKQGTSPV